MAVDTLMANEIPTQQRKKVHERSSGLCERCGGSASEIHHRRRRGIRDHHTHCLCNLTHLCRTCHHWATVNPQEAFVSGVSVSVWTLPLHVPMQTVWGERQPLCEGGWLGERTG